ncbi:MAG: ABC transporter permease [Planctomycetota bacterium]
MSDASKPSAGKGGAQAPVPEAISGIEAMRGVGAARAKGFWADAWDRVVARFGARMALGWIGTVAFFAVFAPVVANAHPLLRKDLKTGAWDSPLWQNLTSVDILLLAAGMFGIPFMLVSRTLAARFGEADRSGRLGLLLLLALQGGFTAVVASGISAWSRNIDSAPWIRELGRADAFPWIAAGLVGALAAAAALVLTRRSALRWTMVALTAVAAVSASATRWSDRLVDFDTYDAQQASGDYALTYTIIPFSPDFGRSDFYVLPPLTEVGEALPDLKDRPIGERTLVLGSDAIGKDVLSQLLWACRLSISIGLVSTGLAVLIGVTIGALMGYFGGWVDLMLFRVVEIFMAIPVLFLLIVAAAVLPRNTYMMMAIIGCVSWTGAARFTRAEFLKLRRQDFVQGAQAAGLPLRSVLFKHMLPNGVTPVLVDASFAVAAAIIAEATLSFLGLGPDGQASWGKLLSSATGTTGTFVWWLAIFPGFAIFFTVLSYNMLGEAMRDAIDPKLRKAAH